MLDTILPAEGNPRVRQSATSLISTNFISVHDAGQTRKRDTRSGGDVDTMSTSPEPRADMQVEDTEIAVQPTHD